MTRQPQDCGSEPLERKCHFSLRFHDLLVLLPMTAAIVMEVSYLIDEDTADIT